MPPMPTNMNQPQAFGNEMPQMGNPEIGQGMDSEGMAMNGDNGKSEYDTGFDAGVEADEDEDPKRFIQQLTGKLSQSLNKYNNENGDDPELSKYVGKMIAKAAAKGLDEKGKKDLIKSINTTDSVEDEMMDDTELNECVFTKKDVKSLREELNQHLKKTDDNVDDLPKRKSNKKTPFTAKKFK